LHEIKNVKQERGAGRRQWFESDGFELVVWFDPAGRASGFQICYDFGRGEHALTWRPGVGFAHAAVDQGDDWHAGSKQSPVLVSNGNSIPWGDIAHVFDERGDSLDPDLRQLIHDKLAEKAGALH